VRSKADINQLNLPHGTAILYAKLLEMFVVVIALKYASLVSQLSYGHFLKPTDSVLFE